MKRTVEVSCPGETMAESFDSALGGWFREPDPPLAELLKARNEGLKVFKFKLTLEFLDELTSHLPTTETKGE